LRTFSVKEKDLAGSLLPGHVMLERIQKVRDSELVDGVDYIRTAKGVHYSPAGVERLAELIRLAGEKDMPAPDVSKEDKGPEAIQTLPPDRELIEGLLGDLPKKKVRVLKVFPTNPKYLHAQATSPDATLLTVRVRSNKNFAPGMEMEVVKGIGGVWDYAGFMPRARGRW